MTNVDKYLGMNYLNPNQYRDNNVQVSLSALSNYDTPKQDDTLIIDRTVTLTAKSEYREKFIPDFPINGAEKFVWLNGAIGLETGVYWKIISGNKNQDGSINTSRSGNYMINVSINDGSNGEYFHLNGTKTELNDLFKTANPIKIGYKGGDRDGENMGAEIYIVNETDDEKTYHVMLILTFQDY